jgi:hypothetical protein
MTTYLVTWKLPDNARIKAYETFARMTADEHAKDYGPDLKVIGRWHNVQAGTGVLLVESPTAEAVSAHLYNWLSIVSFTTEPMLDDAGARNLILSKIGERDA